MKAKTALLPFLLMIGGLCGFVADSNSNVATARVPGCNVTTKAENKSLRTLVVVLDKSKVRSKQLVAGPWADLIDKDASVEEMYLPAKSGYLATTFQLNLWCNLKRQYKFLIEERVGTGVVSSVWVYYPSSDDWADAGTTTIDLGNIGRHFN